MFHLLISLACIAFFDVLLNPLVEIRPMKITPDRALMGFNVVSPVTITVPTEWLDPYTASTEQPWPTRLDL